jgi:hypothetical protein
MGNADTNTVQTSDLEQAQIAQLASMANAAGGDFDAYVAFLRGERKLT